MKTTRKILSILLVLAMVCALFVTGVTADEPSAYQEGSAVTSADGTYVGMPLSAESVTSLSADGDDEDTLPDLLTGYYIYPSSNAADTTWTGRRVPEWNMTWNKNLYLYAGGSIKGITNSNKTGTDEIGMYRDIGGVRYFAYKIYLGLKATLFENGIGVIPTNGWTAQQNYIMYDVEDFEFFYSVVGLTGTAFNNQASNKPGEGGNPGTKTGSNSVYFQVFGSKNAIADTETECKANDDSFVLLSEIEIAGTTTAEFNVNVSEYKTLKLVVKAGNNEANDSHVNSGCNAAWGGASVYNMPDLVVNYDGNGGKTADDKTVLADDENVVNSDVDTVVFMVDNCTFEKEGYLFKGWNTKADGTGTDYAAGDALTLTGESNVTLYAQWEEKAPDITYYKVTFVADGATVGEIQVEAGKDATLPDVPAKDGYTAAWDKDGKAISADTTITAVYTIKTYTVTFVIPEQENTTATVEHGADVTLPTAPAKAGYLVVWDHTGKGITADTTITASYKREYKTVEIKLKQDPSGAPKGSNKTYLSDLHDASDDGKNLGLNQYVIDQGSNSKIILNASYSQPAYYFIEGARKVGNGNGVDADGYRVFTRADGTTIKIHKNDIVLGYTGTRYEKGLGVHPNTKTGADRYIVYDISSLDVNAFYAVAGATGNKLSIIDTKSADYDEGRGVTFEVWGSTDERYNKETTEFVKLAFVDEISGYNIGEFKVNIEGINFLKLVVKVSPDATTNDSSAVAWGGAMVYKADTSADTSDGFSMTAIAAAIVAATSVVALVVNRKKFF